MGKRKTREQFIEDVYEGNESYRNGEFEIVGEYTSVNKKVLYKDKYGEVLAWGTHLQRDIRPGITSAIDKNQYFINQAIEVYGDLYDYSLVDYKDAKTKILIGAPVYGFFEQAPNRHLEGRSHSISSAVNKKDWFENKAREVHGDKYDYSLVEYKNNSTKVKIIGEFGVFEQTPSNHLQGQGCPKEGDKRVSEYQKENSTGYSDKDWIEAGECSEYFDSFKVYIIECWNENERFIKIGKTFNIVDWRFRNNTLMPYQFKSLQVIEGGGQTICDLERELQKENKTHNYIPELGFSGMYECFSKINNYE